MTRVFLDTETGGLLMSHPIIQVAAVAYSAEWEEIETFETKVAFDWKKADPQALKINGWTADAWLGAPCERDVARGLELFLGKHRTVELVSKRTGNPYTVARVGGHNVGFDLDRMGHLFKRLGLFLPVHYASMLDTLHGARWFIERWNLERRDYPPTIRERKPPADFKLTTLAEWFGLDATGAHDALCDVRLSAGIARHLLGQ